MQASNPPRAIRAFSTALRAAPLLAAIAVGGVLAGRATPVSANLDLSEMGALLAVPFVTAGADGTNGSESVQTLLENTLTEVVVTNGLAEAVTLHINIVNGDAGEKWQTQSLDCFVTARETTHFVFRSDGAGGSTLEYECSVTGATAASSPDALGQARTEPLVAAKGIMVIALEQGGLTVSRNALFGEATVIDSAAGMAWSAPALSFQGLDPLSQDGDRQYRFNGLEYSTFPASLATNFLAPNPWRTTELLLFSLDGTADVTPVSVSLRVFFYDDDETERDAKLDFDCFDIVTLESIDPRLTEANLGSTAGHLTLTPQIVVDPTVHEATGIPLPPFVGFRNRPAHGWILSATAAEDVARPGFVGANPGMGAAWARPLAQSTIQHLPLPGDVVNLDAR